MGSKVRMIKHYIQPVILATIDNINKVLNSFLVVVPRVTLIAYVYLI